MRDDIVKFQQIAKFLLKEGIVDKKKLLARINVSEPTLMKILNDNPAVVKLQASVLGKVQDFIKCYIDYYSIAIVEKDDEAKTKIRKKIEDDIEKETLTPIPVRNFWTILRELEECIPDNVEVNIKIVKRK